MSAYEILTGRGVTRLCHFTKLENLTHILSSNRGIVSSNSIRHDTKHVTDLDRYDGESDYVCCSVQYPNLWYLEKAKLRNSDLIFRDWSVIYIDVSILKSTSAKFCPCNASRQKGYFINHKMEEIGSIFAKSVPTFQYPRKPTMLRCCPTDGQAEILIKDSVPLDYICGIAVDNENLAKRIYAMLKIYGLKHIPIFIAPVVVNLGWSKMIQEGNIPTETQCFWSEEE